MSAGFFITNGLTLVGAITAADTVREYIKEGFTVGMLTRILIICVVLLLVMMMNKYAVVQRPGAPCNGSTMLMYGGAESMARRN